MSEEDGAVAAFAGSQVDRSGGAGRERYGDDLAALAGDRQGPVSALQAQVLDVGAGGFRDPQPVQREQGDQRMLERRPEPGGHQQGSQFVAIQGGGMRLIIQAGTPYVCGRGMVQELFFNGVLVEPGDGGLPPGDSGAGVSPGFQFPGEPFNICTADGEQGHGTGAAPSGELAQVQCIGVAVSRWYPARNPARASRSASVKAGWIVTRAVDGAAVVIGHLPAGLRPGRLGQRRVPAIERKPKTKPFQPITPCRRPPVPGARSTSGEAPQTAESVLVAHGSQARQSGAHIDHFCALAAITRRRPDQFGGGEL
jgi:hypothetical protein